MQVLLRENLIKRITKEKLRKFGVTDDDFRWNNEIEFSLKKITIKQCSELYKLIEPHTGLYGTKACLKEIEVWVSIMEGKELPIVKTKMFEQALVQYLLPTKRRWLYHRVDDNEKQWVASKVTKVEYIPEEKATRDRSGHPEYIHVKLMYKQFGAEREFYEDFYASDVNRKTIQQSLAMRGYYGETEELRNGYLVNLEKYTDVIPRIGKQYILNGVAQNKTPDDEDDYGRTREVKEKIRDMVQNKVVIDVFHEDEVEDKEWYKSRNEHVDNGGYFWEREEDDLKTKQKKRVDLRIEDPIIEVPVHPFVIIFDLQRHMRMSTHITTLTEYIYDTNISEKLILPKNIKELINILIQHKTGNFVDIIRGKSGGAIVALTGKAGVGKTLTAEVFAENTEKALYSVQASQLGIEPAKMEVNLKLILRRASRWGAILLIDEADVFVAERGTSLIQDAICGIFLRMLEYHTSMLFLTTNRPETIDDAILSRCIARIDYKYPNKMEQKKIWKVLCESSGINISEETIDAFVKKYPQCSGRDVKNLIKLVNLKASADKEQINLEGIEYVMQFNPTVMKKQEGHTN